EIVLRFELLIFDRKLFIFFPQLFLEKFNIIIRYIVEYNFFRTRFSQISLLVTNVGINFWLFVINVANRIVIKLVPVVIKVATNLVASGIKGGSRIESS